MHRQHLFRIAIENLPRGRHQDFLPAAIKELFPTLLLKQANLGADGGLRAKQLLRRPGEALQLRHFQETTYLVIVHCVCLSAIIYCSKLVESA